MMPEVPLEPLPYHRRLRDFLKHRHAAAWEWFASEQFHRDGAESVRLDLLKSCYRLEREPHAELYDLVDQALERLQLDVPVTLYQKQDENEVNAFMAYLWGHTEIHVVFEGPILKQLTPQETTALLGHEITHYLFWDSWDHQYFITHNQVRAMAEDPRAETCHEETARLDQLYTEIFADRGALVACGDLHQAVAMLVKVVTGLEQVSAESYLRQADEIFERDAASEEQEEGTVKLTHPEAYIRARALRLWAEGQSLWAESQSLGTEGHTKTEEQIERMIHGRTVLDRLDLLGQVHWTELTRRLIRVLITPPWFQTEAVLAHAHHFFDDFEPPARDHRDETLFAELQTDDPGLRDYVCYLLVDFVALARDLEDAPLVAAFALANQMDMSRVGDRLSVGDRLGVGDRLREILAKELKVLKRDLDKLRRQATREVELP